MPDERAAVDAAVRLLQTELADRPDDLGLITDYVSALMVAGTQDDRAILWVEALDVLEEARRRLGSSPELLFNRALLLETLGLTRIAEPAWREAATGLEGGWRAEALRAAGRLEAARLRQRDETRNLESRLDELDADGVDRHLRRNAQAVREAAERRLLEWAASERPDLETVRLAADRLRPMNAFLADTLDDIEQSADPPAVRAALVAWRDAKESYESGAFAEAAVGFEEAWRSLDRLRVRFAKEAALYTGICDLQFHRAERALSIFEDLWSDAGSYPHLRGRAAWMIGLTHDAADRHGPARRWFDLALGELAKAGEQVNVAAVKILIADDLEHLGRSPEAWHRRLPALRDLGRLGAPPRRFAAALQNAQDLALGVGLPHAAAVLGEEIVARDMVASPYFRAFHALRLAGFASQAGDEPEARRWRRLVQEQSHLVDSPRVAEWLQAEVQLMELRDLADSDSARVLGESREIARAARRIGRNQLALQALVLAGKAARATGRANEAKTMLEEASGLALAASTALTDDDSPRLLDLRRSALDALVDLLAEDLGQPAAALAAVETWLGGDAGYQRELPPGIAVLAVTQTSAGLHRWWIAESGVEHRFGRISSLRQQVDGFAAAIDLDDQESAAQLGRILFRDLFQGFEIHLDSISTLVIRPDGVLHRLPWGALLDENQQALAFRVPLAIVQTSESVHAIDESVDVSGHALVVGAPEASGWATLEGAAAEAATLSSLYPRAHVLTGAQATVGAVLGHLETASVLHVGAHGQIPLDLGRPRIILADENGQPGHLDVDHLQALGLSRLQLAVLGSCRSTGGPWTDTGGPLGISRALARSGVQAILASRFELADDAASKALIEFHELVVQGATPARALFEVRRNAYRRGEPAKLWSGLDLFLGVPRNPSDTGG